MPSSAGQLLSRQEQIINEQDEELEMVGNSVRTLRGMSSMIGDELDQQSIMLDDLGQEMEYAETRLDTAMKKMAKLTHLEDESSQCKMIMVLSALLFFLIFVLIL